MAHLVVFESADERIFPIKDARAAGGMCWVIRSRSYGLKPPLACCVSSGFGSTIKFERSGSSNASMRVASEVSLKMKTGVLYLRAIRAPLSIAM